MRKSLVKRGKRGIFAGKSRAILADSRDKELAIQAIMDEDGVDREEAEEFVNEWKKIRVFDYEFDFVLFYFKFGNSLTGYNKELVNFIADGFHSEHIDIKEIVELLLNGSIVEVLQRIYDSLSDEDVTNMIQSMIDDINSMGYYRVAYVYGSGNIVMLGNY